MKSMPHILKFMSAMPHTIGSDQPLNRALEIMRQHRIRHLPVLDGGKLVGVLSDRDVKLGASFADSEELTVDDVMTPEPYSVLPEAPVNRGQQTLLDRFVGIADHRLERRDHVPDHVFGRIMQEQAEPEPAIDAAELATGNLLHQQSVLRHRKNMIAAGLPVPAGDAGEPVRDVLDLDIEQ